MDHCRCSMIKVHHNSVPASTDLNQTPAFIHKNICQTRDTAREAETVKQWTFSEHMLKSNKVGG